MFNIKKTSLHNLEGKDKRGGEEQVPAGGWKRGWLGATSTARVSNSTKPKLQQTAIAASALSFHKKQPRTKSIAKTARKG